MHFKARVKNPMQIKGSVISLFVWTFDFSASQSQLRQLVHEPPDLCKSMFLFSKQNRWNRVPLAVKASH